MGILALVYIQQEWRPLMWICMNEQVYVGLPLDRVQRVNGTSRIHSGAIV